jgi:hypothetical protein
MGCTVSNATVDRRRASPRPCTKHTGATSSTSDSYPQDALTLQKVDLCTWSVFYMLLTPRDQARLRSTCTSAVDAFNLAVRNRYYVQCALSLSARAEPGDCAVRWFPCSIRILTAYLIYYARPSRVKTKPRSAVMDDYLMATLNSLRCLSNEKCWCEVRAHRRPRVKSHKRTITKCSTCAQGLRVVDRNPYNLHWARAPVAEVSR